MIEYDIYINSGSSNMSVDKKTITVRPVRKDVEQHDLLREIHHMNPLVPEQVISDIIGNLFTVTTNYLASGKSVSIDTGNGALATIYPDVNIDGGSIDAERAEKLCPDTEDITEDNAAMLVSAAGVKISPKIVCTKQFYKNL